MRYAYRLGGLKLASDIGLPALPVWNGEEDAPADLVIRLAEVPDRLANPNHAGPTFQTSGGSQYLMTLPGTGRILVRDGREILVDPEPGADPTVTSAVLTGPIQAVVWHQRGILPLHASVVVVDGRAAALCGASASGKSTLAAMLAARGHTVIADDLCLVDTRTGTGVSVLPGGSRVRVWRDAFVLLSVATRGLPQALAGKGAYFLDCGNDLDREPKNLASLVLLSRERNGAVTIERLRGSRAMHALPSVVHTRRPAGALGRNSDIFAALMRLGAAGVSIWQLKIPEGPLHLREAVATLLTALES